MTCYVCSNYSISQSKYMPTPLHLCMVEQLFLIVVCMMHAWKMSCMLHENIDECFHLNYGTCILHVQDFVFGEGFLETSQPMAIVYSI